MTGWQLAVPSFCVWYNTVVRYKSAFALVLTQEVICMGNIPVNGLIKQFQTMYEEHWEYKMNSAKKGCVDCSGAFVYAYEQYGKNIAHGSNTIGRKYVGQLLPISQAEPGMAAFKCKDWTEDQKGNRWYGKEPGNLSHIGLVDVDTGYVLNAKGEAYGFCRDKLTQKNGWDFVAYLTDVDYSGGGGGKEMVTISGGNPNAPINMRDKPGGKLVTKIPQGSTAELLAEEDDWDYIKYDGKTGFVMSQFVHKSDEPEPEPSTDTVAVNRTELEAVYDTIGNWLGLRG